VRIKARIAGRDLREGGERALLNFGHTLAHALEAESGYAVPHGEAVAIGMVAAARVGERLGVTRGGTAAALEEALGAVGLPVRVPAGTDAEEVVRRTSGDKKNRGAEIRMVLLRGIGRPLVEGSAFTHPVEPPLLRAVVEEMTG
jgi:3-dehydroquinate synthase